MRYLLFKCYPFSRICQCNCIYFRYQRFGSVLIKVWNGSHVWTSLPEVLHSFPTFFISVLVLCNKLQHWWSISCHTFSVWSEIKSLIEPWRTELHWLRVIINEFNLCCVLTIVVLPESNGFIFIEANGGLNQQRTSVGLSIFSSYIKLICFTQSFLPLSGDIV